MRDVMKPHLNMFIGVTGWVKTITVHHEKYTKSEVFSDQHTTKWGVIRASWDPKIWVKLGQGWVQKVDLFDDSFAFDGEVRSTSYPALNPYFNPRLDADLMLKWVKSPSLLKSPKSSDFHVRIIWIIPDFPSIFHQFSRKSRPRRDDATPFPSPSAKWLGWPGKLSGRMFIVDTVMLCHVTEIIRNQMK